MNKRLIAVIVVLVVLALSACGGGGSSESQPAPTPVPPIEVPVTPVPVEPPKVAQEQLSIFVLFYNPDYKDYHSIPHGEIGIKGIQSFYVSTAYYSDEGRFTMDDMFAYLANSNARCDALKLPENYEIERRECVVQATTDTGFEPLIAFKFYNHGEATFDISVPQRDPSLEPHEDETYIAGTYLSSFTLNTRDFFSTDGQFEYETYEERASLTHLCVNVKTGQKHQPLGFTEVFHTPEWIVRNSRTNYFNIRRNEFTGQMICQ